MNYLSHIHKHLQLITGNLYRINPDAFREELFINLHKINEEMSYDIFIQPRGVRSENIRHHDLFTFSGMMEPPTSIHVHWLMYYVIQCHEQSQMMLFFTL